MLCRVSSGVALKEVSLFRHGPSGSFDAWGEAEGELATESHLACTSARFVDGYSGARTVRIMGSCS